MPERKPCRCLLAENQPDLARTVEDYVASLPEGVRAPETVYRSRLALCLRCENLRDGTCALCGCYAEARAAKAAQQCPAVPPRWTPEPEGEPE